MTCRNTVSATPPATPSGLQIEESVTGVQLSWDAGIEPDLIGWKVYRSSQVTIGFAVISGGSPLTNPSFKDTTGDAGQEYFYKIVAVGASLVESLPLQLSAQKLGQDLVAPAAVTGAVATLDGTTGRISWTKNTEADLESYRVYRGIVLPVDGTWTLQTTTALATFDDLGLDFSTTYYYDVRAVDTSGNEGVSIADVAFKIVTPVVDVTPPTNPDQVSATVSTANVTLTWAANTEADLAGYNVTRDNNNGGGPDVLLNTNGLITNASYVDTGGPAGTQVLYKISAVDTTGNESATSTIQATRLSGAVPAEVFDLSYAGTMVPCVVHARLVPKSKYNETTGATAFLDAKYPLSAGTYLTAQYEFDFSAGAGDDQGYLPRVRGFNAAHVYDRADSYTIRGTITPDDRSAGVVYEVPKTFVADTRRIVYVSPTGMGSGTGATTATAVNWARAIAIHGEVTGTVKFLLKRGTSFQDPTTFRVTKTNVMFDSYSDPLSPSEVPPQLLFITPQLTPTTIRVGINVASGAVNTVIQNINVNQSYTGGSKANDWGIQIGGENTLCRRVDFYAIGDAFHFDSTAVGTLIQECNCPLERTLNQYFCGGLMKGEDAVILNCFVNSSANVHIVRSAALDRVLMSQNRFLNKGHGQTTITMQKTNFLYAIDNYFEQDQVGGNQNQGTSVGPLGQGNGNPVDHGRWAVFDRNQIKTSTLTVQHGQYDVMFRNNRLEIANALCVIVTGYTGTFTGPPTVVYNRGNYRIFFYNNTFVNSATSNADGLQLGSITPAQPDGEPVGNGVTVKNNLFLAVNATTGKNVRLSSITNVQFDRNIWSGTTGFLVGSTTMTLAQWNAQDDGLNGSVGTDDAESVPPTGTFQPATGSKALTFGRPVAGVWEDAIGNPRGKTDATWACGAIEASKVRQMGVNLESIHDYDRSRAFINAIKHSRKFGTAASPIDEGATVDANGNPTVDFGMCWDRQLNVNGTYKFSCTTAGSPVAAAVGGSCAIANPTFASGVFRCDVVVNKPVGTEFLLQFKVTGTSAGATNVKLLRPGYTSDSAVFTNEFLAFLAPFQVIRFMDWTGTNDSALTSWASRRQETFAYYTKAPGVPFETCVRLANAAGKDMWICIPAEAEDGFVSSLGTYIKGNLNAGLYCYVEYSNEVWNGQFDQNGQNYDAAQAEVVGGDVTLDNSGAIANTFYIARRRVGKRLMQIRTLLNDSTRFRMVLMGQLVDTTIIQKAVDYITEHVGTPKSLVYAIGCAAYFSCGKDQVLGANLAGNYIAGSFPGSPVAGTTYDVDYTARLAVLSSSDFLTRLSGKTNSTGSTYFLSHKNLAAGLGVKLAVYEGGLDFNQWNCNVASKLAADRDSGMQAIIADYMTKVIANGAEMHCYFASTGGASVNGYWELTEDVTSLTAYKYLGWRQGTGR